MSRKRRMFRIGLLFSLLGLLWIAIPCENHCLLVPTVESENHHCECDSDSNSSQGKTPFSQHHDSLQFLCKSISVGFTNPNVFSFQHGMSNVNKVTVGSDYNHCQVVASNHPQYYQIHAPPFTQITTLVHINLMSPHAPPTFS